MPEVEGKGIEMTFWDHLEELRGTIFRSIAAIGIMSVLAFCFKRVLFDVLIFAPLSPSFITYRILGIDFGLTLVNLEISSQFMVHLKAAAAAGFILACPYVIFEIWKFVSPALYAREKKAVRKSFGFASGLFYLGLVVGYFVVLPFCLDFFVDYQVSESVRNTISLTSYISLFTSLVLTIGLVFELPTVITLLSAMGVVNRRLLRKYRKHAFVIMLIIAAIITPADPLSMIVLAIPLYMLYEFSIFCAKEPKDKDQTEE